MLSNTSTRSTEKPESSSAGALRPYSTSSLGLPNYVRWLFFGAERGKTSVAWTEFAEGTVGAHLYTFSAQETQDAPQPIPPEVIARVYCHAVVSSLPEEALPELVDELRDLELEFLMAPQLAQQPPTPTSKVSVKVGKSVPRPGFYIDAE